MEKGKCSVWKKLSKIDFNFFDSNTNSKDKILFKEIDNYLLDKKKGHSPIKKVVINGGHYIPNLSNQDEIGKNPLKTWKLACQLTKRLGILGFDSYISLMINDLPFTPEDREKIRLELPKSYRELMEKYGLDSKRIVGYSRDKNRVYTEKKLANRFPKEKKKDILKLYKKEISGYCTQAIITYLLDLSYQDVDLSIWIVPKCTHENLINSLNIFQKGGGKIRNICYFITNNCYL